MLKRGVFRSLFRPLVAGIRKYGFRGVLEGIRLGKEAHHLAGDSWQQGGMVLLDTAGGVLHQHKEQHPADWGDLSPVLRAVGADATGADYSKALQDFFEARGRAQSS